MYEHCGLFVIEQHQEAWHCTCIYEKPQHCVVPELEFLLKQLIDPESDQDQIRSAIVKKLRALPTRVEELVASYLDSARDERTCTKRFALAAEIRRVWRGA